MQHLSDRTSSDMQDNPTMYDISTWSQTFGFKRNLKVGQILLPGLGFYFRIVGKPKPRTLAKAVIIIKHNRTQESYTKISQAGTMELKFSLCCLVAYVVKGCRSKNKEKSIIGRMEQNICR